LAKFRGDSGSRNPTGNRILTGNGNRKPDESIVTIISISCERNLGAARPITVENLLEKPDAVSMFR